MFWLLAVDTVTYFQPAVMGNPYLVDGFYNPPWLLPVLFPLKFLSPLAASTLMRVVVLLSAVYASWRLSKNPLTVAAYVLSAPILFCLLVGNIDALIINGIFLPPALALIVLSIKPQLTIGVMLYIIWKHGLKSAIPLVLILALSLLIYGWWPAAIFNSDLSHANWNHSIWPWGIGLGIGFLLFSTDRLSALASSAFFSPYVSGAGWAGLLLYLATKIPIIILVIDLVLILRLL